MALTWTFVLLSSFHTQHFTTSYGRPEYLTEERQGRIQTREDEVGMETNGDPVQAIPGVSLMREEIVQFVQEAGLSRPPLN